MIRLFSCEGREVKLSSSVDAAFVHDEEEQQANAFVDATFRHLMQCHYQHQQRSRTNANDDDDDDNGEQRNDSEETSLNAPVSTEGTLLLPRRTLIRECELVSRILAAMTAATRRVNDTDDVGSDEDHGDDGSDGEQGSDEDLDLRGLACASSDALSILSVWLLSRADPEADTCLAQPKNKQHSAAAASSRLQFAPISIPSINSDDVVGSDRVDDENRRQQEAERQHRPLTLQDLNRRGPRRVEGVLVPPPDDSFPARVSFDLESCFSSNASPSASTTRKFCIWLVNHYSWPQITNAHVLANFLGCRSLAETLAHLTALHLRQVAAMNTNNSRNSILSSIASDAALVSNGAPGAHPSAGLVSPAIAVENTRKRAEEILVVSLTAPSSAAAAAAAAATSGAAVQASSRQQQQPKLNLATVVTPLHNKSRALIERELYESVMFLRGELSSQQQQQQQ